MAVLATMPDEPKTVGDILDRLVKTTEHRDAVSLGDISSALGARSYGPFLLVPALIEISPIGGIPGVPTLLAAIIILFAGQMVLGRERLWLPPFAIRRTVSAGRLKAGVDKLSGVAKVMDRWFHGRMEAWTRGWIVRFAAGAAIILALSVPPLELLPFASTAPMAAIAAFGLALLVKDGALMIAAAGLAVATLALAIWLGLS